MVQLEQVINGEGFLDFYYTLLWQRHKNKHEKQHIFNFIIPNTIIIKDNSPVQWYFSNKQCEVKKKKPSSMTIENIIDEITNANEKSGIAGYYLYQKEDYDVKIQDKRVHIEYIKLTEFEQFLRNDNKYPHGVFQQFKEPQGCHNNIIQTIWSPNLMIMEKRVNKKNLHDQRISMEERALTFEGEAVHSSVEYLKGCGLSVKIKKACQDIINHIYDLSYEKFFISRMIVYFKIDKDLNVNFLWCSQSKIEYEKQQLAKTNRKLYNMMVQKKISNLPLNLNNQPVYGDNGDLNKIFSLSNYRPQQIIMKKECIKCNEKKCDNDIINCPLKFLVDNYLKMNINQETIILPSNIQMQIAKQQGEQKIKKMFMELKLPKELYKMFPKMGDTDFDNNKDNLQFLNQEFSICIYCYLELCKSQGAISGVEKYFHQTIQQKKPFIDNDKFNNLFLFKNDQNIIENRKLNSKQADQLFPVFYKAQAKKSNCRQQINTAYQKKQYHQYIEQQKKLLAMSKKEQFKELILQQSNKFIKPHATGEICANMHTGILEQKILRKHQLKVPEKIQLNCEKQIENFISKVDNLPSPVKSQNNKLNSSIISDDDKDVFFQNFQQQENQKNKENVEQPQKKGKSKLQIYREKVTAPLNQFRNTFSSQRNRGEKQTIKCKSIQQQNEEFSQIRPQTTSAFQYQQIRNSQCQENDFQFVKNGGKFNLSYGNEQFYDGSTQIGSSPGRISGQNFFQSDMVNTEYKTNLYTQQSNNNRDIYSSQVQQRQSVTQQQKSRQSYNSNKSQKILQQKLQKNSIIKPSTTQGGIRKKVQYSDNNISNEQNNDLGGFKNNQSSNINDNNNKNNNYQDANESYQIENNNNMKINIQNQQKKIQYSKSSQNILQKQFQKQLSLGGVGQLQRQNQSEKIKQKIIDIQQINRKLKSQKKSYKTLINIDDNQKDNIKVYLREMTSHQQKRESIQSRKSFNLQKLKQPTINELN